MQVQLKKQILSNTITFIAMVSFILLFQSIFGNSNTLVGVTVVTAGLIFMNYDLTQEAIRNVFVLTCINILLGFMAHWAAAHIYLGLLINFLALAGIGYVFSQGVTKSLVIPFGLQYLFMLYTPVSGVDFYKRIGALAFGAIFIMLLQLIKYFLSKRKKVTTSSLASKASPLADPSLYYTFTFLGKTVAFHKLRVLYALRLGICISITAFITGFFCLSEGRWMSYTIFSITEFYAQDTHLKARHRISGTIIGCSIVIIAFFLFTDNSTRTLLILLAGYLNSFFTDYKHTIIIVTISAVASVALTQGSVYIGIERILFVLIGTAITFIGNSLFHGPTYSPS